MGVFADRRFGWSAAALLLAAAVFAFVGGASHVAMPPSQASSVPASVEAPATDDAPAPVAVETAEVPILVYHRFDPDAEGPPSARPYTVTPEEFRAHMAIVAELGYAPITVGDLLDAFNGVATLPERPVILTFDDGRAGQYAYALPVLREHGFVGVIYPFTNAIDRPGYLTQAQLEEFLAAGFEIGSHTRYHPYLTKESDEDLRDELTVSAQALKDRFGIEVRSIAWPFGLVDDRVIAAATAAGYEAGRGLSHGRTQRADDRMDLHAYIATGDADALRRILE